MIYVQLLPLFMVSNFLWALTIIFSIFKKSRKTFFFYFTLIFYRNHGIQFNSEITWIETWICSTKFCLIWCENHYQPHWIHLFIYIFLKDLIPSYFLNLKLVSTIFYQIFNFNQMLALQKLWKMLFISSKKLFSFSRYSHFCFSIFPSFSPYQPLH